MRKIISKEEEEKSSRRKQLIVGLVLIIVMLLSTVGYSFMQDSSTTTSGKKAVYNGVSFYNQNGFWITQLSDRQFIFKHNPLEVPRIEGKLNTIGNYSGKPLYFVSENSVDLSDVFTNMEGIALRMNYACLEDESCPGNFPIKTCQDNMIVLQEKNVTSILQENNCVFISSPSENVTRVVDEFLFKILSIDE